MNFAFLATSLILLALGLIGLALDFYVGWMWVVVILGMLGSIWGWLIQSPESGRSWRN